MRKTNYLKKKHFAFPHFSPQNSQEMDWDLHPELRGKIPPTSRMKIIYKNSVRTSQRTRYFFTTKTNQLGEAHSCTLCARYRVLNVDIRW